MMIITIMNISWINNSRNFVKLADMAFLMVVLLPYMAIYIQNTILR